MTPDKLVGDTGYGSAEMLGWLVEERGIAPHIPVWDKSKRTDGTFSREDFRYDPTTDSYTCPGNKELRTYRRNFSKPRRPNGGKDGFIRYRASKHDCDACPIKPQCCPGDPGRRVMRSVHEAARDVARDIRIHYLVHPKAESRDALRSSETIHWRADDAAERTKRRIRTVPARSHSSKPQKDRQTYPRTATNRLKEIAKTLRASTTRRSNTDFFNTIRTEPTLEIFHPMSAFTRLHLRRKIPRAETEVRCRRVAGRL